jgi:hypothetical protein
VKPYGDVVAQPHMTLRRKVAVPSLTSTLPSLHQATAVTRHAFEPAYARLRVLDATMRTVHNRVVICAWAAAPPVAASMCAQTDRMRSANRLRRHGPMAAQTTEKGRTTSRPRRPLDIHLKRLLTLVGIRKAIAIPKATPREKANLTCMITTT